VIEAAWLFGLPPERISVVVHPQSIVHSLVEFIDGSQVAQLSHPDMRGPIAYALRYPGPRVRGVMQRLNLSEIGSLEFRELDPVRFPAVGLAKSTVVAGGAMSAVFSVANEVAVGAFLGGGLSFLRIVPMIEEALARFSGSTYTDLASLQGLVDEVSRWVKEQCRLSVR
jgi:1-deoxy-D-xylulose-5-phosphate reductoisomerase